MKTTESLGVNLSAAKARGALGYYLLDLAAKVMQFRHILDIITP